MKGMHSIMATSSKKDFETLHFNMVKATQENIENLTSKIGLSVSCDKYCCGQPMLDIHRDGKFVTCIVASEKDYVAAINGEIYNISVSNNPYSVDILNSHLEKVEEHSEMYSAIEGMKARYAELEELENKKED